MSYNVHVEAWRKAHVRFEGQCLVLFMPAAEQPGDRYRSGTKADREAGIFEPARGQLKSGPKQRTTGLPVEVEDASFSEACRLNPIEDC